jgi:hypothetical protein
LFRCSANTQSTPVMANPRKLAPCGTRLESSLSSNPTKRHRGFPWGQKQISIGKIGGMLAHNGGNVPGPMSSRILSPLLHHWTCRPRTYMQPTTGRGLYSRRCRRGLEAQSWAIGGIGWRFKATVFLGISHPPVLGNFEYLIITSRVGRKQILAIAKYSLH